MTSEVHRVRWTSTEVLLRVHVQIRIPTSSEDKRVVSRKLRASSRKLLLERRRGSPRQASETESVHRALRSISTSRLCRPRRRKEAPAAQRRRRQAISKHGQMQKARIAPRLQTSLRPRRCARDLVSVERRQDPPRELCRVTKRRRMQAPPNPYASLPLTRTEDVSRRWTPLANRPVRVGRSKGKTCARASDVKGKRARMHRGARTSLCRSSWRKRSRIRRAWMMPSRGTSCAWATATPALNWEVIRAVDSTRKSRSTCECLRANATDSP
mmetsp:Transcript_11413/g.42615  ORF Transcript_11413/g.42615 Transcript_11413/m.42615 type:complete len:270 (+) Transcript_11413:878-1687(+)